MPALSAAAEARDSAMAQVEANAGPSFPDRAREFVLRFLACRGEATGETITDAAMAAGIIPSSGNSKAFGAVYARLAREGRIVRAGFARRTKGHCSYGATLWRVAP